MVTIAITTINTIIEAGGAIIMLRALIIGHPLRRLDIYRRLRPLGRRSLFLLWHRRWAVRRPAKTRQRDRASQAALSRQSPTR
jgi:hypothetical protein